MWRDLESHQSGAADPGSISPSYKELYLLGCCSTVAATAIFGIWGREVCDRSGPAAVLHLAVLSILENEWWSKPTRNSSERHSVCWAASGPNIEQLGTIVPGTVLAVVPAPRSERSVSARQGSMLLPASTALQLHMSAAIRCLQHLRLISWGYLPGTDGDFHVLWWHIRNSKIHRLIVEITVFILVPSEIRYLQIWVV